MLEEVHISYTICMDDQMNPQEPITPIEERTRFSGKKILYLFSAILFIVGALLLFSLLKPSPQPAQQNGQSKSIDEFLASETQLTWKLTMSYDLSSNTLTLDSLDLLNKAIKQDFRLSQNSPFDLNMLDKNNALVYQTKISVSSILPDMPISADTSAPKTIVYVPYVDRGEKIWILNNNKLVLQVTLPSATNQTNGRKVIQQAYAEELSECRPIQIVFMSDGYSNMDEFHSDVEYVKNALINTAPFSESSFDFQVIDNTSPLDCGSIEGGTACMNSSRVTDIGFTQFPDATIFAVISNTTTGGGTAKKPGNVAIIRKSGSSLNDIGETGIHEILGHALSGFQERYVMSAGPLADSFENAFRIFGPNNNCSANSDGEDWWREAREPNGQNAYPGCAGSPNLYAPEPLSCPKSTAVVGAVSVQELGTPESIMSSPPCARPQFDAVETYWIQHNVLPNFSCGEPKENTKPTTSPRATPTIKPSATPVPIVEYHCDYSNNCSNSQSSLQICSLDCKKN